MRMTQTKKCVCSIAIKEHTHFLQVMCEHALHHVWTFLQVISGLKTLNYILIHFFLSDLTLSCSCYILELIIIVF